MIPGSQNHCSEIEKYQHVGGNDSEKGHTEMGKAARKEHFLLRWPSDDGKTEGSVLPHTLPHHRDLLSLLRIRVSYGLKDIYSPVCWRVNMVWPNLSFLKKSVKSTPWLGISLALCSLIPVDETRLLET